MQVLTTERLTLRPFSSDDSACFAQLNADPDVMADLGGPLSCAQSDAKLSRYVAAYQQTGLSRFHLADQDGAFVGYCGIMEREVDELGRHYDLGWRLARSAWRRGYASEAAQAILTDCFAHHGLIEVLAYTGPDNVRSQNVMERLGLTRRPDLDFSMKLDTMSEPWEGLVWSTTPSDFSAI